MFCFLKIAGNCREKGKRKGGIMIITNVIHLPCFPKELREFEDEGHGDIPQAHRKPKMVDTIVSMYILTY